MSYWKTQGKNLRSLDNFSLATNSSNLGSANKEEFYELELGIVLDIVLDQNHPIFKLKSQFHSTIDADRWPETVSNQKALRTDLDFSWIGRALIRPISSEKTTQKDHLPWAFPLENNISEYPLINETVILVKYLDKWFYSKKLNSKNIPNNSLDFGLEPQISGQKNIELYKSSPTNYVGPISKVKYEGGLNYEGVAGRYFIANNKIRTIKRFEGDLLFESRFGQTIHFSAYDDNRENDSGRYPDYNNGGNPYIIIRNRQRPLLKEGEIRYPHKKLPPIIGTIQEKNVGGYIEENINHDGSSIYITSGQTISQWVTTCYKKMFGTGEEVKSFDSKSQYKYPVLDGDQIIINSDRLIFSSRYGEIFNYSKQRYGIVTDKDYIVDAHEQAIINTNTKCVINSPAIYLGEYDVTDEPALLGQTTINWLYELCNWLIEHTHWHIHSHIDAGKETPSQTQTTPQLKRLIQMRDRLHELMSRRVFLTGGGFAPGKDGGKITDGAEPTTINIKTGKGVPGDWKGTNYR